MTRAPTRRALVVILIAGAAAAALSAQTSAKHFLWRVLDSNGAAVQLLGSIHVMPPSAYPLSPEIERAFEASKVLVEEVNLDEANDPQAMLPMLAKAMLTDGRTLDQVISAETFAAVKARTEQAGLPMIAVERMKPWMVSIALTAPALRAAGFDLELGLDKYFFTKAKKAGIERRALETVAYQIDRFDQMSLPLQETLLTTTLRDLDTEVTEANGLVTAWTAGDPSVTEKLLVKMREESPDLYRRLLVERNQNWIEPIERCLHEHAGCFIVVGAAHLVGPDGLLELLEKKGYTVQQE
jgi:uncharacterized protein